MMGHTEVVELLRETLDEEQNTDITLSALAESSINDLVPTGVDKSAEES